MIDPGTATVIAGIGGQILGGLFGGGEPAGMAEQAALLKKMGLAFDEQMNLYNTTDIEAMDAATVANFNRLVNQNAERVLRNYEGTVASKGGDPNKFDTETSRSKALIAEKASSDTANLEATLNASRPQRKAAMLPNTAGALPGLAQGVDAAQAAHAQAQAGSMAVIGSVLGDILRGSKKSSSGAPNVGTAPINPSAGNPVAFYANGGEFTFDSSRAWDQEDRSRLSLPTPRF
jgi:hypothetical protein